MTRRELFARSLPFALLSAGVLVSLPGCEGGDSGGTDLAKINPDRQAELDKMGEASAKATADAKAKKK